MTERKPTPKEATPPMIVPHQLYFLIDTPSGMGVYAIVCLSTGESYVGSAKDIAKRSLNHLRDLRRNNHHASKLQSAWDSRGPADFRLLVLEFVAEFKHLGDREQFFIDRFTPTFNGTAYVTRSSVDCHRTISAGMTYEQWRQQYDPAYKVTHPAFNKGQAAYRLTPEEIARDLRRGK